MVRVAWITDIHLDFLDHSARRRLYDAIRAAAPDAVLCSGDISESNAIESSLQELGEALGCSLYFVLGNHDYYRGSIVETRRRVARLCAQMPQLVYLTDSSVVELTPETALVGHDGWADGRLGDFAHSDVILNDYLLIEELHKWKGIFALDRESLGVELARLGDETARHWQAVLPAALATHRRVVAVTHVPPYREACWYGDRLSDDNWLPHFACCASGEALSAIMRGRPDRELLVLCGHTHSASRSRILENIEVQSGAAEYGVPRLQRIFEFA